MTAQLDHYERYGHATACSLILAGVVLVSDDGVDVLFPDSRSRISACSPL